jgi:hypothetical protein
MSKNTAIKYYVVYLNVVCSHMCPWDFYYVNRSHFEFRINVIVVVCVCTFLIKERSINFGGFRSEK